ncbi:hypothetical protein VNO80_19727 [Phaseolus coccineus]|uniref:Uncharacterized protein n=1 Tax=Phaseolus coccineus TaxID=3886 RepID=A0AAN9MLH7_PHACN
MIVVVTATEEAETTEYGEDCSCQGLLDRRIQPLTQESCSGKCVFLADMDVKDDSGSRTVSHKLLFFFSSSALIFDF